MTSVEAILSRALLVRDRVVPADIVPSSTPDSEQATPQPNGQHPNNAAADDLRALCETLVSHTPAGTVTKFVTEQVPEPRSALILACVLQLTDAEDGARFWWQYAAGAGQAAAAYCLYLHHLALGEDDTALWWHRQTDDVQPAPEGQTPDRIDGAPTTTILRVLHHLAKQIARPRSPAVTGLMDYMPTAVATGYLREPDMDLPLPGPDFACKIRSLLPGNSADQRPLSSRLPARPTVVKEEHDFAPTQTDRVRSGGRTLGEAASR
ncbi:hypothetical protein ACFWBC_36940 [Streptomyces sp. NPDC059985]|uniref:hypothetical protein n=1 Tax=Streptomyces sp. NPDC059985 TaxID=3347025 RepID=UPI0036865208